MKKTEERVEHLRQELKEMQKKRDESFLKIPPPPPYISPLINNTDTGFSNPIGYINKPTTQVRKTLN